MLCRPGSRRNVEARAHTHTHTALTHLHPSPPRPIVVSSLCLLHHSRPRFPITFVGFPWSAFVSSPSISSILPFLPHLNLLPLSSPLCLPALSPPPPPRPAPSHLPFLPASFPTLAPGGGGGGGVNLGTLDAAEHEARRRGQDAHPLHLASTQPAQGERGCSTCMSRRKSSRTARRGHALRSASAGAAALLACSALLLRLARVRVRSRGPNSTNEGRSGIPTFVLPAGSTLIGSGRS